MSPKAEAVTDRLEQIWHQWWVFSIAAGAVLAAAVSVSVLLLFVSVDALLQLPQAGLWVLFLIWVLVTATFGALAMFRYHQGRRNLEGTARRVEMECPELGSSLINLIQLTKSGDQAEDSYAQAAVAQAAEAVAGYRFEQAAVKQTRRGRFRLCMQTARDVAEAAGLLGGLLMVALLLNAMVPRWSSSVSRLFHPWAFVPSVGSVKILEVTPGDTEVLVGAALEIRAKVENPQGEPLSATLFVRREGEAEAAQPVASDEKNENFTASLPQVLAPLRYRLQIGDTQTKLFTVGVRQKPAVQDVEITYNYPPYIGRPKETVAQKQGDLDGPQFTLAELKVRSSTPITGGYVEVEGTKHPGWVEDNGDTLHAYVFMDRTTTYTIHLVSEAGTDPEPRVNQVRVTTDVPPTVQLLEPVKESTAAPGSKVPVVIRAGDDYGLGLVRLEMRLGEEGAVQTVNSWDKFPGTPNVVLKDELTLDPAKFKSGQIVFLRAMARDRRELDIDTRGIKYKVGPQEATSAWHQIRLVAPEDKSAGDLAQLDALRGALAKVLEQQVRARIKAVLIPKEKGPAEAAKLGGDVQTQQVEIQKATVAVVESLGKTDNEERQTIKKAANKLAFGEMVEAVKQAEGLSKLAKMEEFAKPTTALTAVQDRIIDVLRRLLNEARRETADVLSEMPKKANTELPPDVQAKLRDMKDKLDEFLKQQKKVIDESQNLAKNPVEDFTEKEKQLLEKLAAIEDEWSRFMAEKHSDLSKLPDQDFSNPSLLQEMVEVQTQLKMAEDALKKKSADIAVPLEQLGAEMAKEMTTNIEKWLPDTPDREKWSQEEPLADDMKEAPMAELPKELEDIVGDLMEQEEDLMDEMEDVSSSWADSLDKGAGWDAADGPISNNSARGVTGNRLPNTSEIAGRSGEGRSGKSAGEFVGDEAVGKGGRKTPTRLTQDAFVKGQIKDHSKDPTGGATGGGKESGAGGEGLQGPVPNRPERKLERMATKQAELRNKAEAVDLKFKVMNYHHSDLKKMIDQMASVENDLKGGKYQNALRRRSVLIDGLGQVKQYVKGEFTVRQDTTNNLPANIQKEILGSMTEPSPPGWEGLNRQYFERLGSSGETAAPAAKPAAPAPPAEKKDQGK